MAEQDEEVSAYLESFPTYRLHSRSCHPFKLWVFSSKDEEGSGYNDSSSSDDGGTRMINDKIIAAFSKVSIYNAAIVQFWVPVTTEGGRRILSTSGQPFAVNIVREDMKEYRRRCVEYGYNIDVNNIENMKEQDKDHRPKIINSGPHASAFLNRLIELVDLTTSVHQEWGPLLLYLFEECGFRNSFMMPICCPSESSSTCIGVIECSFEEIEVIYHIHEINQALKEVGLASLNVQEHIPYKTINGLKPARDKIQEALKDICETHNICLAQVWISCEDTHTKRMSVLKLTGYYSFNVDREDELFKGYFDVCDMLALKTAEGLIGKTLEDYEPRFCENISQLDNYMLGEWASYEHSEASGLIICLRDTGGFCYAFEFIWFHRSIYVFLLRSLLLSLKGCLPSFKFASGAQFGDKLHVIDVDKSTNSKITFEIFKSPTPESMEKGKKPMVENYITPYEPKFKTAPITLTRISIEQQFGNTMKVAAKNLNVSRSTLKRKCKAFDISEWQGPKVVKRKVNDFCNNEICRNEKDNSTIQDPSLINRIKNTVTIKPEYEGDMIKFDLPISEATFDTVEKEIGMRFKLALRTYQLKYRDEGGDWISLLCDDDMSYYMETLKILGQTEVRLRVLLRKQ